MNLLLVGHKAMSLKLQTQLWNHTTYSATSYEEVLERLPSCEGIVLDLDYPELIASIRDILERSSKRILVLTKSNGDMKYYTLLEGMDVVFIQKPASATDFEEALNPAVQTKLLIAEPIEGAKKGRPKGSPNKKGKPRKAYLPQIRITGAERAKIEMTAEASGMTLSEYVRYKLGLTN